MSTVRRCAGIARLAAMLSLPLAAPAWSDIRLDLAAPPAAGKATGFDVAFVGDGGYALGGAMPRVWLVPEAGGECAAPAPLSGAFEVGGRLLLTLHADATISAVNPERSPANGNIAWIARLPALPLRWHVDEDRRAVIADLPGQARQGIDAGDGALRPDLAIRAGMAADALVELPFRNRSATIADGRITLSRADGESEWSLTLPPLAAGTPAASALADRLYLLAADRAAVLPLDLATRRLAQPIELPAAADILLASGDGRWLFAIARERGFVTVIDTALGRATRAIEIHAGIGRAATSDAYLYLRERNRAYASLVRLDSLDQPQEHVVAIPVGLSPSDDAMAPLGSGGMAFLHSAERAIYLYMESGMADNHGTMRSPAEMLAPYAVVPLKGGSPIDIAVTERGLRQTAPGRFTGSFRLPHGGAWRLVVREVRTRALACRDFTAIGPRPAAAGLRPELRADASNPRRVHLSGVRADLLPDRLRLIAMVPASNWQKEVSARHVGSDLFEIDEEIAAQGPLMIVPADPALAGRIPITIGVPRP